MQFKKRLKLFQVEKSLLNIFLNSSLNQSYIPLLSMDLRNNYYVLCFCTNSAAMTLPLDTWHY